MQFQDYTNKIGEYFQGSPEVTSKLLITALAIFVVWLVRYLIRRVINRNITNTRQKYRWRKNSTYITGFAGLLVLGVIWFEGFQEIGTFFGLLSAGLAIALRDPVTDFAGWIFITLRTPFHVGDRVEIGEIKGDIIDIRIFKFTVLEIGNWVGADQSTGRVVHMPNHKIFTESVANYTSDFEFIWNELEVLLTFESNWKKAKEKLQEIADKHMEDFVEHAEQQVRRANKSYLVHYEYLTPIVYTDVKESGVNLTIRHLTDPRRRRTTGQALWEDILELVEESDDIDLAYPTMRILNNRMDLPAPDEEETQKQAPDANDAADESDADEQE